MKIKLLINTVIFCLMELWVASAYAADVPSNTTSLGGATSNVMEPLGVFTHALYNICYILGVGFLLGSIIRFKEYRENPSQTPISKPIAIFLFGLVFLGIPLIAKLSSSAFTK